MSVEKIEVLVVKCDQCLDRLERDEVPACVEACPTQTLVFVEEHVGASEVAHSTLALWERVQAMGKTGAGAGGFAKPMPASQEER